LTLPNNTFVTKAQQHQTMPPPGGGKKKKGRAPKHQNTFAFQHNPKSKKTDKILASQNVGVCKRCHEKIEWRKKYRKYKPRTQPGKCNLCFQKNVLAAYHTICTKCTGSEKAIAAMQKSKGGPKEPSAPASTEKEAMPLESTDAEEKTTIIPTKPKKIKRRLNVCAVCTTEPQMSKYANVSAEDMHIVDHIHELEDSLESGEHHEDEHKLTLREIRGVERKIEKLQEELKERRKQKEAGDDDDDEEEADGDENDDDSVVDGGQDGPQMETDDPFLLATGGKAMVGEDYQKMLLAKLEQQK